MKSIYLKMKLSPQDCKQDIKATQLSQRDRAAGCDGFGQKWKTGTGRRYFADIIAVYSTAVT